MCQGLPNLKIFTDSTTEWYKTVYSLCACELLQLQAPISPLRKYSSEKCPRFVRWLSFLINKVKRPSTGFHIYVEEVSTKFSYTHFAHQFYYLRWKLCSSLALLPRYHSSRIRMPSEGYFLSPGTNQL